MSNTWYRGPSDRETSDPRETDGLFGSLFGSSRSSNPPNTPRNISSFHPIPSSHPRTGFEIPAQYTDFDPRSNPFYRPEYGGGIQGDRLPFNQYSLNDPDIEADGSASIQPRRSSQPGPAYHEEYRSLGRSQSYSSPGQVQRSFSTGPRQDLRASGIRIRNWTNDEIDEMVDAFHRHRDDIGFPHYSDNRLTEDEIDNIEEVVEAFHRHSLDNGGPHHSHHSHHSHHHRNPRPSHLRDRREDGEGLPRQPRMIYTDWEVEEIE